NTSSGSRASSGSRTSSGGRASLYDDDESTTVPARRGLNSLLPILLALVGILLIGLLVVFVFFRGNTRTTTDSPSQVAAVATNQAATATAEQAAILGGTGQGDGATETITPTDVLASPTVEPTVVATVTVPDVSTASPALVSANTPLESAGWIYDFNQPTYAAPIIGPLGQYQPTNGRFVVVLVFAVNNTGTTQTIPTEFFVLKDAQGRVWNARPEVSDAYVIPNVNADLSQTQALSSDGLTRSVALIFDVAPDATNLVFFARSNPAQGWLVLPNV
ncbi:MAG: hypothetical protein HGA65_10605, partial [Oscillochloris sp.]|nr:hypothetical protein [Oscillochloris sp.]